MLSTVREAAAVGPSISDVGTSITDDASTSDIITFTTQTIDVGTSDGKLGAMIGVSSTLPVDDTPTGDVRSSSDGVRAPINDDDDVSVIGIAASTIRTVDDSSPSSGDVAASLSTAGALSVGCASNDDDDPAADGIDASTDGEDASTSDSDTVPLIIGSVDVGALNDGVGTRFIGRQVLPEGKKTFPLHIVMKRKRNQFGEITRRKARCVLDGSQMKKNVDCFESYAPAVDGFTNVRLIVSVAHANRWELGSDAIVLAFSSVRPQDRTLVRFRDLDGVVDGRPPPQDGRTLRITQPN